MVQAAVSIFIEQSLGESRSGADNARKFLDEQIRDYEQKLKEAEGRVNAFKLKYMGLFPTTRQGLRLQHGRHERTDQGRPVSSFASPSRRGTAFGAN